VSAVLPSTELPQRCDVDAALWPLTVTRIAVSTIATVANGGTQQNLPEGVAAILTVGVMSGVELGLKGGSTDQWIPVFHAAGFPLHDRTYYLAQRAATADGAVTVLGFATVAAMEYWKYLMSGVTPQQGAAAGSTTVDVAELPAAAALSDTIANPTTTMIGAAHMIWTGTVWRRAASAGTSAQRVLPGNNSLENSISDSNSDNEATTSTGIYTQSVMRVFDGSTGIDRLRSVGASGGRLRTEDSWAPIGGFVADLSTNSVAVTNLYTVGAGRTAKAWVSLVVTAFTGAATIRVLVNGQIVAQYTTAAVGNLAQNLGPYTLAATNTLDVSVTAAGVGTVQATAVGEDRASE
jgi:hypothetical protein